MISLLVAMVMLFSAAGSVGETAGVGEPEQAETAVVSEQAETAETAESPDETRSPAETDQFVVLPVRFGSIQSVTVFEDRVSVVFNPPMAAEVVLGMEAVSLVTDLKEVRFGMADGKDIVMPLIVDIEKVKEGVFITVTLSMDVIERSAELLSNVEAVKTVTLVQNRGSEFRVDVEEVTKALKRVYDGAAELVTQVTDAIKDFREKMGEDLGEAIKNLSSSIRKALLRATWTVAKAFREMELKINEVKEAAGEKISNAAETTGEWIGDRTEQVRELWNQLWKKTEEEEAEVPAE